MIYCNAKLNLYLKIIGKRKDGYHLLNMINVPITVYDEMTIEFNQGKDGLIQHFEPEIDCSDDKTTLYKSYQIFRNFIPKNTVISIGLKKVIPEGSGMGGGSSNAAFFIKELVKNYKIELKEELISEIANRVGADVPFFLFNRPAFLEGIGERVFPFKSFPALNLVVIKPDFSVNTKWAYSLVSNISEPAFFKKGSISLKELISIMSNDLEAVVEEKYFEIKKIKNFLYNNKALKAMMTGSGSSVFGIFGSPEDAEIAYREAKQSFISYKVFKAETIGA